MKRISWLGFNDHKAFGRMKTTLQPRNIFIINRKYDSKGNKASLLHSLYVMSVTTKLHGTTRTFRAISLL